jgi:GH24 family phage-related lysozyme (muramidase)/uncharacterized protein (DUF2345 family)
MESGFKRTRDTPRGFELVADGRAAPLNSIYVGFVRLIDDVISMGRLSVWIPELGGDPNDPNSWFICNYASPFGGASNVYNVMAGGTSWTSSQTSYGMWFVPPDLNNEVVVCFINGDSGRGIWFACLYQQNMNHMVPGIPGTVATAGPGQATIDNADSLPVVEYNKASSNLQIAMSARPVFTPLASQLQIQGLDQDILRGTSTSGARRTDPPNSVYGILTPLQNQFVMDDNPGQAFIRLRTRTGTQVLISDTDGSIYINSADGSNWLNMNSDGTIDIYGMKDISIRSQGSLNFRGDIDVNIEAGRTINMKARNDVNVPNPSAPSMDKQANGGNINIECNMDFNLTAGNIYTYAGNIHARSAGNIFDTADGPPTPPGGQKSHWGNIYIKANGNIFINSNNNIAIQSNSNIYIQADNLIHITSNLDLLLNSGGNVTINANANIEIGSMGNIHILAAGNINVVSMNSMVIQSDMNLNINSINVMVIQSNESIVIGAQGQIDLLSPNDSIFIASGLDVWVSAYEDINVVAGRNIIIDAFHTLNEFSNIIEKLERIAVYTVEVDPLDSLSVSPDEHKEMYRWAKQGQMPVPPTDIDQQDNQIFGPGAYSPIDRETILYRLPFHEPYPYHAGTLVGTDSYISETSGNPLIDQFTGLPMQLGSIIPGATIPGPLVGIPISGMQPGTWIGTDYVNGVPQYSFQGPNSNLASASSYQLSALGIQFLIKYEGFNPLPYTDLGGQICIGVGHALTPDEISNRYTNTSDGQIPWSQGLSDDEIMGLLNQDLYDQGDPIKLVPVITDGVYSGCGGALITQAQFDVIVSFCFNICPIPFMSSTFAQQLTAGNYAQAIIELLRWNQLLGSVNQQINNRRTDEASRILNLNVTL